MMRSFVLSLGIVIATASSACAVGFKTKLNCASDYYAYCSQHALGGPELRKCMHDNGPRLSKACLNALIEDGEVSRADVERERARYLAAKDQAKPADLRKSDLAAAKKANPDKVIAAKNGAVAAIAKAKMLAARTPDKPAKIEQAKARQAKLEPKVARAPEADVPAAAPATSAEPPRAAPVASEPAAVEAASIDEATFEALKNRGSRFVVDEADDEVGVAQLSEPEPAGEIGAEARELPEPAPVAPAAATKSKVAAARPAPAPRQHMAAAAPVARAPNTAGDEGLMQRPAASPEGRMGLGRKLSDADELSTWWDDVLRFLRGE